MNILHTFEIYQKQLDNLRKNNYYGLPQVLRPFRMQFEGFNDADIEILKTFLFDNDKKWFVAHLLGNLDTFPVDLLEPMLLAAIDELDPSSNKDFIEPCRRVFGYVNIQRILLDNFRKGGVAQKIGVLKALYWSRPTVYTLTVHEGNKVSKKQGYDIFFWDYELKSFDEDFKEDTEVFERERPKQEAAREEEIRTILSEFYKTNDLELKYQIALRLPEQINDYPGKLQAEAKKFLLQKKKQGIPNNISELDKVQNMQAPFLRRIILKVNRLFTKQRGITLKQR